MIRKLRKSSKIRLKGLQKSYAEWLLSFDDLNRSMAFTHGRLIHGHTYRLRVKLHGDTVFNRGDGEK